MKILEKTSSKLLSQISLAIFALFALLTFSAPSFVSAAKWATTCDELKSQIRGESAQSLPSYCTVESVYNKIINFALYAVGIVAVIMIIYGGYIYMTSRGNADQAKRGRTILIWAILGLAVVLAASALVNIFVLYIV